MCSLDCSICVCYTNYLIRTSLSRSLYLLIYIPMHSYLCVLIFVDRSAFSHRGSARYCVFTVKKHASSPIKKYTFFSHKYCWQTNVQSTLSYSQGVYIYIYIYSQVFCVTEFVLAGLCMVWPGYWLPSTAQLPYRTSKHTHAHRKGNTRSTCFVAQRPFFVGHTSPSASRLGQCLEH